MAYVSTPCAPEGERWFHSIDRVARNGGIWHLGPVPAGKTWPVAKARCGYEQGDIAVGSHETALTIGTRGESICATCLRALRDELDLARGW